MIITKWVFKQKRYLKGSVERFRARLVAKGFAQIFGLDYLGTYPPFARQGALRMVFTCGTDVFDVGLDLRGSSVLEFQT